MDGWDSTLPGVEKYSQSALTGLPSVDSKAPSPGFS
jgi:hypothetical protein